VNEDLVGLGSYGKTLTVLFTHEAIDVEEDEEKHSSDSFGTEAARIAAKFPGF